MALNPSQIDQRMLTWIAVNDLLQDCATGTEDYLVGFELNLIIGDKRDIWIFVLLIHFPHHVVKVLRKCLPRDIALHDHLWLKVFLAS